MNSNPTAGRLTAIVTGGVLATLAVVALAIGAGFTWLDGEKSDDGYYMPRSRYSSGSRGPAT
jgi:hypothetical protein